MSDKKKIVLIYVGVAVISLFILGVSFLLSSLKKEQKRQVEESGGVAQNVGTIVLDELAVLDEDYELERQDGEMVRLSQLHDKVWIAVQFYAACPMCAQRNQSTLLQIYNEFREEDDFLVTCFSVEPEQDDSEKMLKMQEGLEVDGKNWWFLKAEREPLFEFMEKKMFFTRIQERTNPLHIAEKGRWAHDLGIQVYRGNVLVHKWDEGHPYEQLQSEIREALRELNQPEDE